MTLRALLTLLFVVAAPMPALAFGDCADARFRHALDDRISADATCHLRELSGIPLESGVVPARVVRFDRAFDASDQAIIAVLEDVLNRAGTAAASMGAGVRSRPVTIYFTDQEERVDPLNPDSTDHLGPDVVLGQTITGVTNSECPFLLYKADERLAELDLKKLIAHELFHCFQHGTWHSKFIQPGQRWWKEGSAEYFGMLVMPETDSGHQYTFGDLSRNTGLYESGSAISLAYENVAFFSWLHQNGGSLAVGRFLGSLTAGPAPQNLQRLLPVAEWASFTEDLLEDAIQLPGGWPVPKGGATDIMLIDSDSAVYGWETDAYRTTRTGFEIASPGRYEVSVSAVEGLHSRLRQGEGEWQTLPATIDGCRNAEPATLYSVTTQGHADFRVSIKKTGDCSPCETAGVADSCLAGTWTMTGGGPIEWMRANGMPSEMTVQVSDVTMRLTHGGDFIVNPIRTDVDATDDIGGVWTGEGQSQGHAGHWGAADGVLHFCPISGEIAGSLTRWALSFQLCLWSWREGSSDLHLRGRYADHHHAHSWPVADGHHLHPHRAVTWTANRLQQGKMRDGGRNGCLFDTRAGMVALSVTAIRTRIPMTCVTRIGIRWRGAPAGETSLKRLPETASILHDRG